MQRYRALSWFRGIELNFMKPMLLAILAVYVLIIGQAVSVVVVFTAYYLLDRARYVVLFMIFLAVRGLYVAKPTAARIQV